MQAEFQVVEAPGRVNLIGEHIDYHGLPVLPMALRRTIRVAFRKRSDRIIHAESSGFGARQFEWTKDLKPVEAGDWENYLRAAARLLEPGVGVDAVVTSDLPAAAGLSSSSALLVAFTLCLLRANGREASFEELMRLLPEGEHFVGTRGGGMDHAASLASKAGCASLIEFEPLAVHHIPIPPDWAFLVGHSMQKAEKSGPAREAYNARRAAGARWKNRTGGEILTAEERDAFAHIETERQRVCDAVAALEAGNAPGFGRLLLESHASLRDRLHVSTPALDALVDAAMQSGALGARLTGGGFGGCTVILCRRADREQVRGGLVERFYRDAPIEDLLIDAEPGPGALWMDKS
jgi:galactokinase